MRLILILMLLMSFSAIHVSGALSDSVVLALRMENSSVTDDSPYHYVGNSTAVDVRTGIINNALNFTGTSKVKFGNHDTIFGSANPSEWSCSFWFKTTTTANQDILSTYYGTTPGDNNYPIECYTLNAVGKLRCEVRQAGSVSTAISLTTINTGAWFHAVYSANKTASVAKLFINGVNEANSTLNSSADYFDAGRFMLGHLVYNSADSTFFAGTIDEVVCWNRSITQAEVEYLYASGAPTSSQQYPFSSPPFMDVFITSPVNNSAQNSPFDVHVNLSSSSPSALCTLYDDDGDIPLNSGYIFNNTDTQISTGAISEGNHSLYVSCTNGTNINFSAINSFMIDNTFPVITLLSPKTDNSSVFDHYVNLTGSASDAYLWRVNVSIINSTGHYRYNYFADALTGGTQSFTNATINSTAWSDGIYLLRIEASDSHTDISWTESDTALIGTDIEGKTEIILKGTTITASSASDPEMSIVPVRQSDRISFDAVSKSTGDKILLFTSKDIPFQKYRGKTDYPCHYVFGNYWFDADGLDRPVCTLLDDGFTIQVVYAQAELVERIESIGGLNIREETYSFNITSCVQDWICSGYESCRINDSTYCNATTDLNNCDEAYPGNVTTDFGEFSCDYCLPSVYNSTIGDVCIANILNYTIVDANYTTCCLQTNLSTDCNWNGYNLKLTNGTKTILENCEMPVQALDLGFDVMLVIMILVGLVLLYIGFAYSMHILVMTAGLLFVILAGVAVEVAWIKIFLGILGFVVLMIFAMLEYDSW